MSTPRGAIGLLHNFVTDVIKLISSSREVNSKRTPTGKPFSECTIQIAHLVVGNVNMSNPVSSSIPVQNLFVLMERGAGWGGKKMCL